MYTLRSPEKDYPEDLDALVYGPVDYEGTWWPLFPRIPKDPWGNDYVFEIDEETGNPIVKCLSKENSGCLKGPEIDIIYPDTETEE